MTEARRRTRSATWLAILAALVGTTMLGPATTASAQEPPIEVNVTVTPPAATIGDIVRIRVVAVHDSDVIVTALPPRVTGSDQLASPLPATESLPGGRERTTTEFVLQPFTLQAIDVGSITIEWLREDSTAGSMQVDAPPIEVMALRAADDADLRPLKEQAEVPGAPPAWIRPLTIAAIAIGSLASMAIVALLAWRRMRRRPLPPAVDHTAEERAREALNRLTGRRLVTEDDFQFFYGSLSLIVRRYLEERFAFNATALTTTQLETRMTEAGLDRWQARLVAELLRRADAAIYARRYPDPDSADHDLTMAFEIVELSRPSAASEPVETVEATA